MTERISDRIIRLEKIPIREQSTVFSSAHFKQFSCFPGKIGASPCTRIRNQNPTFTVFVTLYQRTCTRQGPASHPLSILLHIGPSQRESTPVYIGSHSLYTPAVQYIRDNRVHIDRSHQPTYFCSRSTPSAGSCQIMDIIPP